MLSQGGLVRVVDTNTLVPGGSGTFRSLSQPWFDAGQVAFLGSDSGGRDGIYTGAGGPIQVVANHSTPVPGGTGSYTTLGGPILEDGTVSFYGAGSGRSGLYSKTPGGPAKVLVDSDTLLPEGSEKFGSFSSGFARDGPDIVFVGTSNGKNGLYRVRDGSVQRIANQSTPVPSHNSTFRSFLQPSLNAGRVAFNGFGTTSLRGVYATVGDDIVKVFDDNDAPGFNQLFAGPQALSGNRLVFWTTLGTPQVIYAATLPPVTLCSTRLVTQPDGNELQYELATAEPVVWSVWLSYRERLIPLWTIPLPMIERPYHGKLRLPSFPPVGALGFLSSFSSAHEGITCSDWDTFETGVPGGAP